jgi:hypothetical protein
LATAKGFVFLVPRTGLEPARFAALPPEDSASTNFAIWASDNLSVGGGKYTTELTWKQRMLRLLFQPNECLTFMPNMSKSVLIASRVRALFFGPNWTETSLSELLEQNDFHQFIHTRIGQQSAAAVLFHLHYYQKAQLTVLQGGPLTAKDAESFHHPKWEVESDWLQFGSTVIDTGRALEAAIATWPESIWSEPFVKADYGSYETNLIGMLEHSYYHFGQLRQAMKP